MAEPVPTPASVQRRNRLLASIKRRWVLIAGLVISDAILINIIPLYMRAGLTDSADGPRPVFDRAHRIVVDVKLVKRTCIRDKIKRLASTKLLRACQCRDSKNPIYYLFQPCEDSADE